MAQKGVRWAHRILRYRQRRRRKEPQSTGTDYRKGHIYKHSKTLLVHENGTKEGWAHKIDTGRDAVMITKIDTVMILASRTVQARGLIS